MVDIVMSKEIGKVLSPVRMSTVQPDLDVIYLGIWALPETDILKLTERAKEVIPYHYDDVCLLESDFYKGKRLCDFFSRELAAALNAVNNVQITDKEWHVYTGRWLENFIHIYLDRYRSIKFSSENYAIDSCYCAKGEIIPSQTDFDFQLRISQDDKYNLQIYTKILNSMNLTWMPIYLDPISSVSPPQRSKLVVAIKSIIQKCFNFIVPKAEVLFDASYLRKMDILKLMLHSWFKFRPLLSFPNPSLLVSKLSNNVDNKGRQSISNHLKCKVESEIESESERQFLNTLCEAISENIPASCVENFEIINLSIKDYPLPKKSLYTSNLLYSNDAFRLLCSKATISGKRLVIGQHGGHYGIFKWSPWQNYELSIADLYISFGWEVPHKNIAPLSHPLFQNNKKSAPSSGEIVFLANCFKRFFYVNWSNPVPGKSTIEYLRSRSSFVQFLATDLRQKLMMRLHPSDDIWFDKDRLLSEYPNLKFDDHKLSFRDLLEKAEIVVVDNNHTTYLQSLSMGKPTIIFWNSEYWPLSSLAEPIFTELKKYDVFHTDARSAANFLNRLYAQGENGIVDWWESQQVQSIVNKFIRMFARNNSTWVEDYIDRISSLSPKDSISESSIF